MPLHYCVYGELELDIQSASIKSFWGLCQRHLAKDEILADSGEIFSFVVESDCIYYLHMVFNNFRQFTFLECLRLKVCRLGKAWLTRMNYQSLSKEVSYALRHAPWEYELEMDEEGWVFVNQLLDALHRDEKWKEVKEEDLAEMIEQSEKKRYEILNGKIRAYYGHSIPMKLSKEMKRPPDVLYHGTARRFLELIKENGLLPQSRQYVHLSQDTETAETVGKRHDDRPCILVIDAKRAWEDGVKFYLGNEKVWLAEQIPVKYISEK